MQQTTIAAPLSRGSSLVPHGSSRRHWTRSVLGWVGRGLGGLVLLCVVLAGADFAYQTVAAAQDERAFPPPGLLVDVGGHRLHIYCTGSGSPTVVTESGFAGTSLDWSFVQPSIAQTTRICAYDRAGFGWSDSGPSPRDSARIADELHALLTKTKNAGPYVLAGHSIGGLHAQVFASRYSDQVSGLVLLDPTPAAYLASLDPAAKRAASPPMEQLRTIQLTQHIGLTRLFGLVVPMPADRLPQAVQQQLKAIGFRSAVGNALFERHLRTQVVQLVRAQSR